MRKALLALTLLFLVSHAACLPSTFGDLDAINFALGVRDFDVARHQPHPPGYPVFIAAAKVSTAALTAAAVPDAEVRGLAALSALSGALLIPVVFWLARELLGDEEPAGWIALVTVASPLVWFNAVRPLSDLTGLAIVVCAQALLVSVIIGRTPHRAPVMLLAGAIVTAIAIGVRSQSFVLTLPLLGLALVTPRAGLRTRDRLVALLAAGVAALAWAVPLLMASGGLDPYLEALRSQAGEDLEGVVMLWTARNARVAVDAIEYSFLLPWGGLAAGWIVLVAGAAGAARMLAHAPLALLTVVVAFAPYAAFHLLFQETLTTRYALPLVIPAALLAVYAAAGAGRFAMIGGSIALAAWSLLVTVPVTYDYAARPTPPVRAIRDALADGSSNPIGMHAVMLRTEEWYHGNASGRVIRRRHGQEVPALVEHWRRNPEATITFLADPRRSDLALLDPRSQVLERHYDWGVEAMPLLSGVRPGEVRSYTLLPPGWMLDEGWSVTPEIAGQSDRIGAGPHRRPATAWIRSRDEAATLMLGGRNFGRAGSDAVLTVRIGGRTVMSHAAPPGFFFRTVDMPAGALLGPDAYLRLEVGATGDGENALNVGLEQFDLQSPGMPMAGYLDGWQEPEYEPVTGRTWRWMSGRAGLFVRNVGRDVRLAIVGESPLRYFDEAPTVRVSIGRDVLAEFSPADDFSREITIPAALLTNAGTEVVVESDRSFVPGGGDGRSLALRVYSVTVN